MSISNNNTAHQAGQTKGLLVINTISPYAGQIAQDSLDFVVAMSNFGQDVSLLFSDDAVFQLLVAQAPLGIQRKPFTKGFNALHFYDIDTIYVCEQSLLERGLEMEQLSIKVQMLPRTALSSVIASHKHVVTF